jgi:tRNA-modifying protein YgfZ
MSTPAAASSQAFWCEYPRDVVEVVGPDAATYLHSQVSNDLRPLQVGQSCWAFLLQPTGRIDVLLRVWRTDDERFVLDTDAGFGDVLVARVNRFKIRVKADVSSLDWRCIAVRTSDGTAADGVDGLASWGRGVDVLGPTVRPPDGVAGGSSDQLLAARIEAGWPAMGSEIEPGETIPAETGVTAAAVSFTKGCYPGQELVERMDSRGSIAPRLLQVVDVPVGAIVGDAIVSDGVEIGTITSVARARALAYVKRSALKS